MGRLQEVADLFELKEGDVISASERYKVFTGPQVGNTPQKGINWVGKPPQTSLVILRCSIGSGYADRWIDEESGIFLYYLMIEKRGTLESRVNYSSTENRILLDQRNHGAPILLMIDIDRSSGQLEVKGRFEVVTHCHDNPNHPGIDSVVLRRIRD